MDLLDRYINEIRHQLPREKADDIAAEIADDLQSQIEEREARSGHPIDEREMLDLLRAYGNPYVVAYRFSPQQYLIGPLLMPFFWRTFGTLAIAFTLADLWFSNSLGSIGHPFNGAVNFAFHSIVWIFAIVVGIFVAIERTGNAPKVSAWFSRWDPLALPPVVDDRFYVARPKSGAETIANTVMLYIVFTLLREWKGTALLAQPAVKLFVVGFVFSLAIVAAGAWFTYIRPSAGRVRLVAHVVGYLCVIAGCAAALSHGAFALSQWFGYGLSAAILVSVIAGGVDLWQLVRPPKAPLQMLV